MLVHTDKKNTYQILSNNSMLWPYYFVREFPSISDILKWYPGNYNCDKDKKQN